MERVRRDGVDNPRVEKLRDRIKLWRQTRGRRTRMPAELWARAVVLAKSEGTYRIARALRVDYQTLARRVAEADHEGSNGGRTDGFIELRGADLLSGTTVVELSDAEGVRLTIRLGGGTALDAATLVSAFLRRGT
jgi:hypothetical protein